MLPKIIKQSVTDLKEILVQELGKLNASIVIEGTKAWDEEEVQEENNETTNQAGKPNANANPNPKPSQNVLVKTGEQAPIVLTSVLLVGSAAVLLLLKLRKTINKVII